jgi:hypothetical protein
MDYKKIYDNLITSRKLRIINSGIYYEKHHIIMKSMGGTNDKDNLVLLTPREHFLAHWLLFKIYGNAESSRAFFLMSNRGKNKKYLSSRAYAEAREAFSKIKVSEETRRKIGLKSQNRFHSNEQKKKNSDAHLGKTTWNKGISNKPEQCKNISKSLNKFYDSDEGLLLKQKRSDMVKEYWKNKKNSNAK